MRFISMFGLMLSLGVLFIHAKAQFATQRATTSDTIIPSAPSLYLRLIDNFHEVTPGILYRSAQLSSKTLDQVIRDYGIKTVINLRGACTKAPWWQQERSIIKKYGLRHVNIALSANEYPLPHQIDELLRAFRSTPLPVLIHCKGGADRTGLACAAWMLFMEGSNSEKALNQLTFIYRHFEWARPKMREFIQNYAEMLHH